ncbi:MAG: zf-HC2 domain-containing protein [Bacteroidota bacterium]
MNKEFDGTNKIEAYLRNELSPRERSEFEAHITQDPLLQNELTIQSEIISALQNYRKVELKQRLNQIDVSTVANPSNYLKIVGLAFIAVILVGVGTFLYLNQNEIAEPTTPSQATAQTDTTPLPTIEKELPSATQPPLLSADTSQQATWENTPSDTKTEEWVVPASKLPAVKSPKSQPTGSKAIRPENEKKNLQRESVDDATKHGAATDVMSKKLVEAPKEEGINTGGRIAPNTEKNLGKLNIVRSDSKYNFHYQFKNGDFTLYGDFSRGYKRFFLKNQEYLFFEDNFYPIDTNQVTITPLLKVTDAKQLEQLREIMEQY